MVERVTVAVDGGPASDAAVEWVIHRTRSTELVLDIVAAVGLDSELPTGAESHYRTPFEDALDRAKARVRAAVPGLAVTTTILRGLPHEALVTAGLSSDLLVIGTNKTSPIAGIVHGTLALKVAGQSSCVTVVVPVNWVPGEGQVVAGWDNDPISEEALDFAAAEASHSKSSLLIVHTWTAAPTSVETPAIIVEEIMTTNRSLLATAAHRIERAYPHLSVTQGLHPGSAAVAIVRAARGASLVVVGSRGRGAIAGFFLGSISHDVLLNMPAPVAVIPKWEAPLDVYPDILDEDF
ncbi:nucleotide-binding universal stress UspA family protein [Salinibacterium sp. CAN_S4]|uniref:universal stress protein n=1 Tax=Salinibacterium sp. CAN_S4 TaxID=2787727 RepID=UPI0018EF80E4